MSQIIYRQIKQHIDSAESVIIITDRGIDGDTIGSCLGLFHILKDLGKEVAVYSPKDLLESLEFLPGKEVIRRNISSIAGIDADLVFTLDCSDHIYADKVRRKLKAKNVPLIVIDHHESNRRYGDINLIEDHAASTGDVLWRFIKWADFPVSRHAAQCILTAICTDTRFFINTNTTIEAFDSARELTHLGAKLSEIVRHTMMNKDVKTLKLWGLAFERLHQNDEHDILTTVITDRDLKRINASDPDIKAMKDYLNVVLEGHDGLMVLEQKGNDIKGGLRSHKRNILSIAKKYGGGGHAQSAGFLIQNAFLEERNGSWRIVESKN